MNDTKRDPLEAKQDRLAASHMINSPKSQLIRIASMLEERNPREAERMHKIITRLELFQNSALLRR